MERVDVYMTTPLQEPPFPVPFVDDNKIVSPIWQLWLFNNQSGLNSTSGTASGAVAAAGAAQTSANGAQTTATAAASAAAAAQATANAAATPATVAAETARAEAAEALLAPIANPTFTGTVTEPAVVLTGAIPTVGAAQLGLGATTAATATAGAATLPAAPVGFIVVNVAGTIGKIPYYAT
jgi:hypothetical protein